MDFLDKTGLARLWQHILAKLSDKVDKVPGKGLSTEDYTTEEKNKLAAVPETFVQSVNGKTGAVELTPGDIGAQVAGNYLTAETLESALPPTLGVDETLTQEGAAADAKAVGDALAEKQTVGDYALKEYVLDKISEHNVDEDAHNDIRLLIEDIQECIFSIDYENILAFDTSAIAGTAPILDEATLDSVVLG